MADQKVTQLNELTEPISTDQIYVVDDPAGTPISKKLALSNLIKGLTGTKAQFDTAVSDGNIAYDGGAHHDGFSDFVANEHIDHTAVTATAGNGLSGGGTIDANFTIDVDINGQTEDLSPAGADWLLVENNAGGTFRKVQIDNLGVAGSPGGSDTQVQYNNATAFGGMASTAFASNILTITAQATTDTPLVMKGAASQTAAVFEVQNNAAAAQFQAFADGNVRIPNLGAYQAKDTGGTQHNLMVMDNGNNILFRHNHLSGSTYVGIQNASGTGHVFLQTKGANRLGVDQEGRVLIDAAANGDASGRLQVKPIASEIGITVTLNATTPGNGLVVEDSVGTDLFVVDENGAVTTGTWSGTAIEGTAIASTGEAGGTKYLREDGDGTCSWQTVAGGGDVTKVGTPADSQIGVWTGDGTIEGDADFTFDTSTNTFAIAGVADTSILAMGGANILVDSPRGTMTLSNIDALDATTEATIEAAIDTLANLTAAAALATVGTITAGTWSADLAADTVDAITEIAAALKSGTDLTLVTGTAGTSGNLAEWNADGDVVDASVATSNVALLAGRAGGQTLQGGTAASENLDLESTSHGTKGAVQVKNRLHMEEAADFGTAITKTPSGTTETLDFTASNKVILDLGSASGAVTLTLTAPAGVTNLIVEVRQGGTVRDLTWPAAVKWPDTEPDWGADSANQDRVVALWYNGTNYIAQFTKAYTP